MKENRVQITNANGEKSLGDIYSHTYEGNEIKDFTISFDGRVYGKINIDNDKKIHITPQVGITYQYQDMPEIQLVHNNFTTCPNCKNKSLTLARTTEMQPSMWWSGSYHNYYGMFCPNCWYGVTDIHEYFNEGEDIEDMEKRLIEKLNI